ncbi:hypothetical protein N658DRAFT_177714 [Parathielavia hyrcaniae]|uniref:Uncharacterized protein n=1 Tax=Parathielavia hyrcaniae TaxID=113614 RepID=A0AAN6Q6E1_9PEZI|nr:hypothetical protein N658DRAFT_177714 [Parathielavia hyrcaniae]
MSQEDENPTPVFHAAFFSACSPLSAVNLGFHDRLLPPGTYAQSTVSLQNNTQNFNWQQPGEKEVIVLGSYVAEEVSRMYGSPRGTSKLDVEHVKFVPGYKHYL